LSQGTTNRTFNFAFAPGNWYYIVITVNGTVTLPTATLYVNAALPPNSTITLTSNPITLGPAWIGRGGSSTNPQAFFQGAVAGIRFWNGLLDLANIQRLMYLSLFGTVMARDSQGQTIATLIDNWPCYEGYGSIAFDYSGPFNLLLGNGEPAVSPDWQVSTILKPPDFVDVTAALLISPHDFLLQPQLEPLVRIRVVQPPPLSFTEPKAEKEEKEGDKTKTSEPPRKLKTKSQKKEKR
jgi:hypothetical protein